MKIKVVNKFRVEITDSSGYSRQYVPKGEANPEKEPHVINMPDGSFYPDAGFGIHGLPDRFILEDTDYKQDDVDPTKFSGPARLIKYQAIPI